MLAEFSGKGECQENRPDSLTRRLKSAFQEHIQSAWENLVEKVKTKKIELTSFLHYAMADQFRRYAIITSGGFRWRKKVQLFLLAYPPLCYC
jgi:hypothetical protein